MNYVLIGLSFFLLFLILGCMYLFNSVKSTSVYYDDRCPDFWLTTNNLNNTNRGGCYIAANKANKGTCSTSVDVTDNYCHSNSSDIAPFTDQYTVNTVSVNYGPPFENETIMPIAGIYTESTSRDHALSKTTSDPLGPMSTSWNKGAFATYNNSSAGGYNPDNITFNARNKAGFEYTVLSGLSDCEKFRWADANSITWDGITNNHTYQKDCKTT